MKDSDIRKYAGQPRSQLRRTDRAISDPAEIKQFLKEADYGVLATTHDGQPYATPVNYAYIEENNALYFHGAHTGRARANIALNPQVCFNVSQMGALTPGKRISDFGVDYRSVTVFGLAEKVTDEDEQVAALLALMTKLFPDHTPGEDYTLPEPGELKRTAVYRITIEEWSGKERIMDPEINKLSSKVRKG
jgi:nitroimidazol reductase NimA-like FMN-containing flavoprotein (pyridoxamine 5'-phosphate oxidase superfamily)